MMHMIGPECDYLFVGATQLQKEDERELIKLIDSRVKPKTNACFERFRYRQLVREQREDVNQFVSRCKTRLEKCALPNEAIDIYIIDSLVHNLQDLVVQQVLFQTKNEDMTLQKVIDTIQIHEAGTNQVKEIQSCRPASNLASIHQASVHQSRSTERRSRTRSSSRSGSGSSHRSWSGNRRSWSRRRRSGSGSSNSKGGYKKKHHRKSSRHNSNGSSKHYKKSSSKAYKARSPTPARNRVSSASSYEGECDNCTVQHGSDWCPAANKVCHGCGKRGHFASKCK